MTIKIEEIGMIVINDARASETFVEMGRTAANERGPNHQDGTTVTVKIRPLSRRYTDESTHRCYTCQWSTTFVKATSTSRHGCVVESSWTCTMAVRVWMETFLASVRNFATYYRWTARDELFHLKASLENGLSYRLGTNYPLIGNGLWRIK